MVARLALLEQRAQEAGRPFPSWAIAGRDTNRLRAVLGALPAPGSAPEVIADVDVQDPKSLADLAARARVLLNAVGPYSPTAEAVVEACVGAGSHYADLSGELPLLRRVIDRFHEPARAAGCQVVQLAGWEALPPDVTGLHAARLAAGVGEEGWARVLRRLCAASTSWSALTRPRRYGPRTGPCPPARWAASSRSSPIPAPRSSVIPPG